MDSYPIDPGTSTILETLNRVLTYYYVAELVCKLIGVGVKNFVRDIYNLFDTLIVVLGITEIIIGSVASNSSTKEAITAFRCIRLMRVFKLVRSWKALRNLLKTMGKTIFDMKDFSLLLGIFMLVFSLIGREIYSNSVKFDDDDRATKDLVNGKSRRLNFDGFDDSLLLVFVMFTNDQWNSIMYDHIRTNNGTVAAAYFICLEIVGNFILLKLFLAILINNFALSSEQQQQDNEIDPLGEYLTRQKRKIQDWYSKLFSKKPAGGQSHGSLSGVSKGAFDEAKRDSVAIAPSSIEIGDKNMSPDQKGEENHSGTKKRPEHFIFTNKTAPSFQRRVGFSERSFGSARESPFLHLSPKVLQKLSAQRSSPKDPDSARSGNAEDASSLKDSESPSESRVQSRRPSFIIVVPKPESEQEEQQVEKNTDLDLDGIRINSQDFAAKTEEQMTTQEEEAYIKYLEEFEKAQNKEGVLSRFKKRRYKPVMKGKSLFFLTKSNYLRSKCFEFVTWKHFDQFILFFIAISSINLALTPPLLNPASMQSIIVNMVDLTLTIIFTAECAIKILAFGFILNGPDSYLRNLWNILDFFIVTTGLISYNANVSNFFRTLKILRVVRVLRPLRLIQKNEGLKLVVDSLLASLPGILNLLVVNMMFFLVFGVFGIYYFKGAMSYCDTTYVDPNLTYTVVTKTDCMDIGGVWLNADSQFDNIMMAISTLFQVACLNGWTSLMFQGVDAAGIDLQPIQDNNRGWVIYYILFVLVGGFFVLNLFCGVVVDIFNQEKKNIGGLSFLTPEQADWVRVQLLVMNLKPRPTVVAPKNAILKKIFYLTQSKYFEYFINAVILVNVVLFVLYWDRQSAEFQRVLDYCNNAFILVYIVEFVLKLLAEGRVFFQNEWNVFDTIVLILTVCSTLLDLFNISRLGKAASVIRSLRVGRILRLIRQAKSLRVIFSTLVSTLPSIVNIGALLLLVVFVYAVLGMNLFGFLRPQESINRDSNFYSFGVSFMTLIRISTGEDWNDLMTDCARTINPNFVCYDISDYDTYLEKGLMGCGSSLAWIYFISFQLIFTMILLNLLIAVIIEAFEETSKAEAFLIPQSNYEDAVEQWGRHDPKAKAFIPIHAIEDFFEAVPPPLGWQGKKKMTQREKTTSLKALNLPMYHILADKTKYYYFYDILLSASRKVIAENYFTNDLDPIIKLALLKQIEVRKSQRFRKAITQQEVIMMKYTSEQHISVRIIERGYQRYKYLQKLKAQGLKEPIIEKKEKKKRGFFGNMLSKIGFGGSSKKKQAKRIDSNNSNNNSKTSWNKKPSDQNLNRLDAANNQQASVPLTQNLVNLNDSNTELLANNQKNEEAVKEVVEQPFLIEQLDTLPKESNVNSKHELKNDEKEGLESEWDSAWYMPRNPLNYFAKPSNILITPGSHPNKVLLREKEPHPFQVELNNPTEPKDPQNTNLLQYWRNDKDLLRERLNVELSQRSEEEEELNRQRIDIPSSTNTAKINFRENLPESYVSHKLATSPDIMPSSSNPNDNVRAQKQQEKPQPTATEGNEPLERQIQRDAPKNLWIKTDYYSKPEEFYLDTNQQQQQHTDQSKGEMSTGRKGMYEGFRFGLEVGKQNNPSQKPTVTPYSRFFNFVPPLTSRPNHQAYQQPYSLPTTNKNFQTEAGTLSTDPHQPYTQYATQPTQPVVSSKFATANNTPQAAASDLFNPSNLAANHPMIKYSHPLRVETPQTKEFKISTEEQLAFDQQLMKKMNVPTHQIFQKLREDHVKKKNQQILAIDTGMIHSNNSSAPTTVR